MESKTSRGSGRVNQRNHRNLRSGRNDSHDKGYKRERRTQHSDRRDGSHVVALCNVSAHGSFGNCNWQQRGVCAPVRPTPPAPHSSGRGKHNSTVLALPKLTAVNRVMGVGMPSTATHAPSLRVFYRPPLFAPDTEPDASASSATSRCGQQGNGTPSLAEELRIPSATAGGH